MTKKDIANSLSELSDKLKANKSQAAASSCNPTLGAANNGVYLTSGDPTNYPYKIKTLNASSTSNTIQYFRLGILEDVDVAEINFKYTT